MVYESDFYTTRRPYTRPISTSYTVTVKRIPHLLPYIAHKRLITVVHTPVHSYYYPGTPLPIRIHSRVRPSVLAAELQRIRDLPRTSYHSYTASYLNSKPHVLWDDETREIRARADALLRRIHVFVPRPLASDFAEDIVPERMHSDDYIRRLIGARKNAKKDEEPFSYYESPDHRHFGTGNLACVAYTGGKPHSRRRPYYKLADLRPADVQSDVNMLSYYAKNRQAAASALLQRKLDEDDLRRQVEELKRWKQEEEERRRRLKEENERRLAEIEEQERLEAERKTEEERWEAERIRDAKLAEIEKRAAEFDKLLATEEESRYAIEKANEEAHKRQEREERLASEVILGTSEDLHHPDGNYNECHCHPDVNYQELEERPESPDAEDETQIEETECGGETDYDDSTDPFIVEHEGFNSAPAEVVEVVDETAIVEESDTNVDNFWGDSDA